MAHCEWVLTQHITSCPDFLLVSVLAILVQVCLDVVSHSFRLSILTLALSFRFMCVLLWRGTGRCWRWFPTPRALSRVLVPMVFLYVVCYALPGADAMEDSSVSGSSSGGDYSRTRELSSLSADTWEVFAFWFKNMAKLKKLVLPFRLPIDSVAPDPLDFGCLGEYGEVSEGEDPCEDAPEKSATGPAVGPAPASLPFLRGVSVQKFCEQNSTLHGLLGLACAKCIEACQIHDQFFDACDGIGAFGALEVHALGQATGESVEGILTTSN